MARGPQETIGLMLRGHLVINNNKYKNSASYVRHEQVRTTCPYQHLRVMLNVAR